MASAATVHPDTPQPDPEPDAFLLTWDGETWRDAVRLRRHQVTTIGRSTTNRLVLQDDSASRNHCEVFFADSEWRLRDLGSRNGTLLEGRKVSTDEILSPGDVISIGACQLTFCLNPDDITSTRPRSFPLDSTPQPTLPGRETPLPSILHSASRPQFTHKGTVQPASASVLSRLYQLGLELGAASSRRDLAEVVLAAFERETVAMIAAVLVLNADSRTHSATPPAHTDLQLLGYRSRSDLPYRRVSDNLSRKVLDSGTAVLARDIADDRQLSMFDSLGEMKALSVICAPIRSANTTLGLIHLYSSNPENPLDRNDLDLLFSYSYVAMLGIMAYGALAALLGAYTKRPIVYGVLLLYGWQKFAVIIPGLIDFLTIQKYTDALLPKLAVSSSRRDIQTALGTYSKEFFDVSFRSALLTLISMTVVMLSLCIYAVRKREFAATRAAGT